MVNFCNDCHSNGCNQCVGGTTIFKRDYQYFCENCTDIFGDACQFCQDYNGCGQCNSGYTRVKDPISGLYYCEDNTDPAPVEDCGPTGEVGDDWPEDADPSCVYLPTFNPTEPTLNPTVEPTPGPSPNPTPGPTPNPSPSPTPDPTPNPSPQPTEPDTTAPATTVDSGGEGGGEGPGTTIGGGGEGGGEGPGTTDCNS